MMDVLLTWVMCLVALGSWLYIRGYGRKYSHSHPPGPRGLPLLRNLFDIPNERMSMKYMEWTRKYNSDIVRFNALGKNIIVVNSYGAAAELFDKRSTIYSDRPYNIMLQDQRLMAMDWTIVMEPYTERWRELRKLFRQGFGPEVIKNYQSMQVAACHELLRRLLSRPERFRDDIRHLAGRIILRTTYGIKVQKEDDPDIELGEQGNAGFVAAINNGSYLVEFIPILKYVPSWFPGAAFQRDAARWRQLLYEMVNKPFEYVQRHMAEGDLPECAGSVLLSGIASGGNDTEYIKACIRGTLGNVYGAGVDTIVSSLCSFFLAMVLYPDVQKKAQQEIDNVLGTERLPVFSDKQFMPYVEAILGEVLRWSPATPLSVPHRASDDDTYKGYFIPKGSIVVGNISAILHDETAYPDPMTFNPDRFMKDGELNPDIRDPETVAFGFGRRKCPGMALAKGTLWISIASILAAFKIEPPKDEAGCQIPQKAEFVGEFLSYPKPFKCIIRPRSERWAQLIGTITDED